MTKYLISYDIGFGDMVDVDDFDTQAEADEAARDVWKQASEDNANYHAVPLSVEHVIDYGLDPDDLDAEQRKIYDEEMDA